MCSKKIRSHCGENLAGVKRHLWLGANTAGGVGGGGVRGGGKIRSQLIVPPRIRSCPELSPDFWIRLFCLAELLIIRAEVGLAAAFCANRYLRCPEFSIVNLYSVRYKTMRNNWR